ncbi:MAG: AzlD domain-containing protein [Firmicutes bacterium]|nr:AzlD domain-containing protein [Bacillota bacterium]
MNTMHSILLIAVMSAVVIFLRAVPFIIFRGNKTPAFIEYIGKYLPYAIMGMLLVYCFRETAIISWPHGLPELIAIFITAGLQVWRKQALLSIVVGTVSYMLLVQIAFA